MVGCGSWEKVVNSPGATICCMPACLLACLLLLFCRERFIPVHSNRVAFVILVVGWLAQAGVPGLMCRRRRTIASSSSSFNVDGCHYCAALSISRSFFLLSSAMFVSHKFPHSISIEFRCTLRCARCCLLTHNSVYCSLAYLYPSTHCYHSHWVYYSDEPSSLLSFGAVYATMRES